MARDKKSLFEWLTGSSGESDYTFDELESGGYSPQTPSRGGARPLPDEEQYKEEEPAGELAVDVHQTPTHIIIKAMIAGVRPEDLDVSITRDMVTIRGRRERATEG